MVNSKLAKKNPQPKLSPGLETITKPFIQLFSGFQDLALLGLRLILAHGFFEPAIHKIENFSKTVGFFTHQLNLPYPLANALLVTGFEAIGVIALFLGFGVRFISIPLMVIMVVAINSVHWAHGFSCKSNGYEVLLYYFLMLFILMAFGAGKYSLDESLFKKWLSTN